MPRYQFTYRRADIERRNPDSETGYRTKTIRAANDAEAAEKMLDHVYALGYPCDIDYEMARLDVPYDRANHQAHFWNMQRAGIQLHT